MISERSRNIAQQFHRYLETGNEAGITKIKMDELAQAVQEYSRHRSELAYPAMLRRLNELRGRESNKLHVLELWKNRGIGFIVGIVASSLVLFLAGYLRLPG